MIDSEKLEYEISMWEFLDVAFHQFGYPCLGKGSIGNSNGVIYHHGTHTEILDKLTESFREFISSRIKLTDRQIAKIVHKQLFNEELEEDNYDIDNWLHDNSVMLSSMTDEQKIDAALSSYKKIKTNN